MNFQKKEDNFSPFLSFLLLSLYFSITTDAIIVIIIDGNVIVNGISSNSIVIDWW